MPGRRKETHLTYSIENLVPCEPSRFCGLANPVSMKDQNGNSFSLLSRNINYFQTDT
jgi:hypothetical protein